MPVLRRVAWALATGPGTTPPRRDLVSGGPAGFAHEHIPRDTPLEAGEGGPDAEPPPHAGVARIRARSG